MADSKASVLSGGKSSPAGSDDNGPSPVLDLRSAKRQVWMVKVPDYVYDKVVHAQQTGTKVELGALRVHSACGSLRARALSVMPR